MWFFCLVSTRARERKKKNLFETTKKSFEIFSFSPSLLFG